MKQEFDIEDRWISYEIHPETPPEGRHLDDLYRGADVGPMHNMLRARSAEFGLPFAPPRLLANSRPAILAAEYARDHGRFPEFSRRVFSAYFAEGRNIGDIEVLQAVAEEVKLDPEDLRRSLDAGEYVDRLLSTEADARRLRITGVPTFFINGPPTAGGSTQASTPAQAPTPSRRIVGAQPLEVFRKALLSP